MGDPPKGGKSNICEDSEKWKNIETKRETDEMKQKDSHREKKENWHEWWIHEKKRKEEEREKMQLRQWKQTQTKQRRNLSELECEHHKKNTSSE